VGTQPFRIELADDHHIVGDACEGSGPYYVFLHGLGSARTGEKSESLRAHAEQRGQGFLRFDLRGHGESSGRLGRVAVSELIADTIQVIERIGTCNLVGSSLGGLVSAHVAAARPDLVERLALLAPAFGLMAQLGERLDAEGRLSTNDGVSFEVEPRVLKDAQELDEAGLPARVQVPTLVIHGTADDVIPHIVSERFHAAMPQQNKQLWIVPGGDHRLNTVHAEMWQRIDQLPTS
jgi:pimeloyl-ACP methyl ester carboxylesterase